MKKMYEIKIQWILNNLKFIQENTKLEVNCQYFLYLCDLSRKGIITRYEWKIATKRENLIFEKDEAEEKKSNY